MTNFGDDSRSDSQSIQLIRNNDKDCYRIAEELQANPGKYGIDEGNIDEVIAILEIIFSDRHGVTYSGPKAVTNKNLSIQDIYYFDRYFDENLSNRLSNIEFQEAFSQSKEIFLKRVEEWLAAPKLAHDLIRTLERQQNFKSIDDFDKNLSALALIDGYVSMDGKQQLYTWLVDAHKLFGKIGFESVDANTPTLRMFGGYGKFMDYIIQFLKQDLTYQSIRFKLLMKFAKEVDGMALTIDKTRAIDILINFFHTELTQRTETDILIIQFYNVLSRVLSPEQQQHLNDYFLQFIFLKDLDGFLVWAVSQDIRDRDMFYIDDWVKDLFGGTIEEIILKIGESQITSDYRTEFLEFCDVCKSSPGKMVSFDFKKIPTKGNDDGSFSVSL